mgnify:CR=1 FL=1
MYKASDIKAGHAVRVAEASTRTDLLGGVGTWLPVVAARRCGSFHSGVGLQLDGVAGEFCASHFDMWIDARQPRWRQQA